MDRLPRTAALLGTILFFCPSIGLVTQRPSIPPYIRLPPEGNVAISNPQVSKVLTGIQIGEGFDRQLGATD
jgi:hypothetical protein